MGQSIIGDQFVGNAGFNEWASSNYIIVLYPQIKVSAQNAEGCWDFLGYTGPEYATNAGI